MINTEIKQKEYNSKIKELVKHKITCTHCGKYLGSIVETEGSDQLTNNFLIHNRKHLCYCTCENECFLITTNRPTSIILEGNHTVIDMKIDDTNRINKIKIGKTR